MAELKYFGTNTKEHGHYFWNIKGSEMSKDWDLKMEDLPFYPYDFSNLPKRGSSSFLQKDGYSVIGFCGSPIDKRGGTCSVFFVKEIISFKDLLSSILSHQAAQEIVKSFETDKT